MAPWNEDLKEFYKAAAIAPTPYETEVARQQAVLDNDERERNEQFARDLAKYIVEEHWKEKRVMEHFNGNNVTGPAHYKEGVPDVYEPRKVLDAWSEAGAISWYIASVIKYLVRYRRKGSPLEDLCKARQYLDWEIERWREKRGEE